MQWYCNSRFRCNLFKHLGLQVLHLIVLPANQLDSAGSTKSKMKNKLISNTNLVSTAKENTICIDKVRNIIIVMIQM